MKEEIISFTVLLMALAMLTLLHLFCAIVNQSNESIACVAGGILTITWMLQNEITKNK